MNTMKIERTKIQQLYDACETVFSSCKEGFPTLKHIRWLQDQIDVMEPMDVGIGLITRDVNEVIRHEGNEASSDESCHESDEISPIIGGDHGFLLGLEMKEITYVHIHQCKDFSIGVFCFPAGAKLPLHDHPEMVVLTKLLYGSVSWKAYDWVTKPTCSHTKNGLAKVVADDCILHSNSSKSSVLFPRSGGNLHSFTALTPCALLDVLSPPYNEELGRPSTYYTDIPIPSLPGFAILEETELPDDLVVVGAPYLGPEIIVDVDSYEEDSY